MRNRRYRPNPARIRDLVATFDANLVTDLARYPFVAKHQHAREWISSVVAGGSPKTVASYARELNEYLAFCDAVAVAPEDSQANRTHVHRYVNFLRSRPSHRGANVVRLDSRMGLSEATIRHLLTVARLFHGYLVDLRVREFNPIPRGAHMRRGEWAFAQKSERALIRPAKKLPWIPDERQWAKFASAVQQAGTDRDAAMLVFAYASGLRVAELCALVSEDLDLSRMTLTVRRGKGAKQRVVPLLPKAVSLLERYLKWRAEIGAQSASGALFVSESNRNFGEALTPSTWAKRVEFFREVAGVPRMVTHTFRHLCLTDLARCGWDIERIALFAGHASFESTRLYIHLAAGDLASSFSRTLTDLRAYRASSIVPDEGAR